MRDLINIIDSLLLEKARGLLYREKGDNFFLGPKNNPTAEIVFDQAEYFPSMPGAYASYDEMAAAGQDLWKNYPAITWYNRPNSQSKAFAILTFDGPQPNQKTYFGRFFNEIKPDMAGFWKNSELPGGWQLNKSVSLKGAYYKLKPADLFPARSTFATPSDAVAAMGTRPGTTPDQLDIIDKVRPGMQQLLQGTLPTFDNVGDMVTAIRDDLGETIGPIALVQGMIKGGGVEAARLDILGKNGSYAGSAIDFPADKNNGLVDSYLLHPSGVEIGISSKGEKGASASVKNIADGVAMAREKEMTKLLTTYKPQVDIIEEIGRLSSVDFPIVYGIKQQIIDEATGNAIKTAIKTNPPTVESMQLEPQTHSAMKNLMSDVKAKTDNPRYNIGYHALAALARRVTKNVNQDPKFGEACLKFLNVSPIIQLHLSGSERQGSYKVTGFTSKYPPDFRGTVGLDATKVYAATGIIGRVSFSYNGGGDTDTDVEPAKTATADLDQITQEPRLQGPGAKAAKSVTEPKTDVATLGREKRRR